jgi:hypothetical protein
MSIWRRLLRGGSRETAVVVIAAGSCFLGFAAPLGCGTSCTAMGCDSQASAIVTLPAEAHSESRLPARVTFCVEHPSEGCMTAELTMDEGGLTCLPTGDGDCYVSGNSLSVSTRLHNPHDLPAGIGVRLRVDDVHGQGLVVRFGSVLLDDQYPNGRDCDALPCRSGKTNL